MVVLSIIVPVYNAESYLEKVIESILNQTFRDFELILINDGSEDRSLEIMKSYSQTDSRVTIINQPNSGVSVARNNGINHAKGRFLAFVDADDYIMPWYYEKMMSHSDASVVISDYIECIGNTKKVIPFEFLEGIYSHPDIEDIIISSMFLGNNHDEKKSLMGTVWRVIIERDIILENNISFNKDVKVAEDLLFLIDVMMKTESVYVCSTEGYYYIRHQLTTLSKFKKNSLKEAEEYIQILNKLVKNLKVLKSPQSSINFDLSIVILYQRIISNYYRYDAPKYVDDFDIKEICQSMNKYFKDSGPPVQYLGFNRRIIYILMKYKLIKVIKLIYRIKNR